MTTAVMPVRRTMRDIQLGRLLRKNVPEDVAWKAVDLAGQDASYAYNWTMSSWLRTQRIFKERMTNSHQREVMAMMLVHRAWTEVVTHPGNVRKYLEEHPDHRENWVQNQSMHLSIYGLCLPDLTDPVRSLRILRAGLVLLPNML